MACCRSSRPSGYGCHRYAFDPSTLRKMSCHLLKAMGLRQEKLLSLLDQTSEFSVPRGNLE